MVEEKPTVKRDNYSGEMKTMGRLRTLLVGWETGGVSQKHLPEWAPSCDL